MKKHISLLAALLAVTLVWGGNPDRQGEAGAYELLLNPWARTVGLHAMNTSLVRGIEAMNTNIAGLSRVKSLEVGIGHSIYLQGTGLALNALGMAKKMGENGALGVSINALSFGKIPVTTNGLPEGTGATFSPTFFNLAVSYAHYFEKKVSVGITLRGINESLADVSAFGFSIDAGVQYLTGTETYPERFKFGISLRNIGSPMHFGGQGLNFSTTNPDGTQSYPLTYEKKAANFELPSQLNIGAAYDILPDEKLKLTGIFNFTSNAFSRDEIGGGLELGIGNLLVLRGGYKYELGTTATDANKSVYTGVAAGLSFNIPLRKGEDQAISIDYGFLHTRTWNGTHNIALRINL
ncbi:MAG: PorV/PorQ family protein [Saprospiraceae bacterium]|nr:PorV/PorQ family protein [Saprospiraceae bacterium]